MDLLNSLNDKVSFIQSAIQTTEDIEKRYGGVLNMQLEFYAKTIQKEINT